MAIFFVCLGIIGSVISVDQILKHRVKTTLDEDEEVSVNKYLSLRHHHNKGFVLNKFEDEPKKVKMFSMIAVIIVAVVFAWMIFSKGKKGLKVGIALVIGGGIANLIDRYRDGYVTDFIRVHTPLRFVNKLIFNVADVAILVGAVVTMISSAIDELDD